MNAMPHYVLGTWHGRILGAFGFGDKQNMAYGLFNFVISIGLFSYQYGFNSILDNGIYAGALLVLLIYFFSGHLFRDLFQKKT